MFITYHKPVSIFDSSKPLLAMTASRMFKYSYLDLFMLLNIGAQYNRFLSRFAMTKDAETSYDDHEQYMIWSR